MENIYKEYNFTVTGTVYATSESHAKHFVYWSMETALNYEDASHASIRFTKQAELDEMPQGTVPAPKPATEHVAFGK